MRRGVRHAEDKFLEPLQGIWSYACRRSDGAGREKKEGDSETTDREFERRNSRWRERR